MVKSGLRSLLPTDNVAGGGGVLGAAVPPPMMRPPLPRLAVSLLALGLGLAPAHAQWDVGLSLGATAYVGEVSPTDRLDYLEVMRPAAGAFGRYQFSRRAAVRMSYQWLRLYGTDAIRPSSVRRNASFRNDLHEVSALLEFYVLGAEAPVGLYLTAGAALFAHGPTTEFAGQRVALRELGTEGQGLPGFGDNYGVVALALPVGGGLRFRLGERLLLGTELIGRVTGTDYLDDLGARNYLPEPTLAGNGPLAVELAYRGDELPGVDPGSAPAPGAIRANPDSDDYYLSAQVTLSYRLGDFASGFGPRKRGSSRPIPCAKF